MDTNYTNTSLFNVLPRASSANMAPNGDISFLTRIAMDATDKNTEEYWSVKLKKILLEKGAEWILKGISNDMESRDRRMIIIDNIVSIIQQIANVRIDSWVEAENVWNRAHSLGFNDFTAAKIISSRATNPIKVYFITNEVVAKLIPEYKTFFQENIKREEKRRIKSIESRNKFKKKDNEGCVKTGSNITITEPKLKETEEITCVAIMGPHVEIYKENIQIDGHMIESILDSGSSINIIPKKILDLIGIQEEKCPSIKIRTIGDLEVNVDSMTHALVRKGDLCFMEQFYVAQTPDDKPILGNIFIQKLTYTSDEFLSFKNNNAILFSDSKQPVPNIECSIDTIDDVPIRIKNREIPHAELPKVQEAIDDLLARGYIELSSSAWKNPLRPVCKPDGSRRITIDARFLNNKVVKEAYTLPRIDRTIEKLQGYKFFTVFDLKHGFYQVNLKNEDRHKTAFLFRNQLYQFTRMIQGFTNSPAIMQRMMDNALRNELGKSCLVYLDDLIVFGKTEKEHDVNLKNISFILKENKIKLNEMKVQFKQTKVKFLGVMIDGTQIKQLLKIKNSLFGTKPITSIKEIQAWLGLINYYGPAIPNKTNKLQKLYDVVGKKEFMWTDEMQEIKLSIENELSSGLEKFLPDFNKRFYLQTDASEYGIGAVLKQEVNGILKPLAFTSRKLTKTERIKHITYKELQAIVFGCKKFKYYLLGKEFTILTDHKALNWITTKAEFGNQDHEKLRDRLSEYQFTMQFIPGEENIDADYLSRYSIRTEQLEDISQEDAHQELKDIIIDIHISNCHCGIPTTYSLVSKSMSSPKLKEVVADVISNCESCQRNRPIIREGNKYISTICPNDKWGSDIYTTHEGRKYITFIDYYTRRINIIRLNKMDEYETLYAIKTMVKSWGKPNMLITDNGTNFTSGQVVEFLRKKNIIHHTTSVEQPQSNGRIERVHRVLNEYLRKINALDMDDDEELEAIQKFVEKRNNLPHKAIKVSPLEAWSNPQLQSVVDGNRFDSSYAKLFTGNTMKNFNLQDSVFLKNRTTKEHKLEDIRPDSGIIIAKAADSKNSYYVETSNGIKKYTGEKLTKNFNPTYDST